ncbi:unnamed protein product [Amoebophrya sp. A25]|nr:unnamed protein product [Amoebophrya sp. A25]|eukprot:GSA25T00014715001.1
MLGCGHIIWWSKSHDDSLLPWDKFLNRYYARLAMIGAFS